MHQSCECEGHFRSLSQINAGTVPIVLDIDITTVSIVRLWTTATELVLVACTTWQPYSDSIYWTQGLALSKGSN
jgi:hypothetical protein